MKLPDGSSDGPPSASVPVDDEVLANTILQMSQMQITLLQKVAKIEADQRAIADEFRRERAQSQTFMEILNKRHESEVDRLVSMMKWNSDNQGQQSQHRSTSVALPIPTAPFVPPHWMPPSIMAARALAPTMGTFAAAASPSSFFGTPGTPTTHEDSPAFHYWQQQHQQYLASIQQQQQQFAMQQQHYIPVMAQGAQFGNSIEVPAASFGDAGDGSSFGQQQQQFPWDGGFPAATKPTVVTSASMSEAGVYPLPAFANTPRMPTAASAAGFGTPAARMPTAASGFSVPRVGPPPKNMFGTPTGGIVSQAAPAKIESKPLVAAVDFSIPKQPPITETPLAVVKPEPSKVPSVSASDSVFGFGKASAPTTFGNTAAFGSVVTSSSAAPLFGGGGLSRGSPQATHSSTTFSFFSATSGGGGPGMTSGTTAYSMPRYSPTKSDQQGDDDVPEHFEPSVHFQPVVPLPDLVEVTTGEEGEKVVFSERCKLFRYSNDTSEWKERGVGDLKILYNPLTKSHRIVMRRDQVLKVCANHKIQPAMSLTPMQKSDRAFVWLAQDFSEAEVCEEKLAARFKTQEAANAFAKAFNEARDSAKTAAQDVKCDGKKEAEEKKETEVKKEIPKSAEQKPSVSEPKGFGDAFKPPAGSWECHTCLVRNKEETVVCSCCGTAKDGSVAVASKAATTAFKPTSFTGAAVVGAQTKGSGISFGLSSGSGSAIVPGLAAQPIVSQSMSMPVKEGGISFGLSPAVTVTTTSAPATAASVTQAKSTTVGGGGFMFSAMKPAVTTAPSSISTTTSAAGAPATALPKAGFTFSKATLPTVSSAPSFTFSFSSPGSVASATTKDSNTNVLAAPTFVPPTGAGSSSATAVSTTSDTATAPVVPTATSASLFSFKLPGTSTESPKFGGPPTFPTTSFKFGGTPTNTTSLSSGTTSLFSGADTPKAAPVKPFESSMFGASAASSTGSVFGGGKTSTGGFAALAAKAAASPVTKPGDGSIKPFLQGGKIIPMFSKETSKSPGEEKKDDESAEDFVPTAHFEPVVPLPSLVELKTGEEDEKVLFKGRAKLYRYVADSNEYKERGVGEIKILLNEKNGRSRVVMRRDQVLKVCANVPIHSSMKISKKPGTDNTCLFQCKDFSEEMLGVDECFVARFKEASLADKFIEVFGERIRSCQHGNMEKKTAEPPSAVAVCKPEAVASVATSSKASTSKVAPSDSRDKKYGAGDWKFASKGEQNLLPKVDEAEDEEEDEEDEAAGDYEDCDEGEYEELGEFPVVANITDAFTSPLKQGKTMVVKGTCSMGIVQSVGKVRVDIMDSNCELKLSHYVEANDKFNAVGPVSLQYLAVSDANKNVQVLAQFESAVARDEALANLNDGVKLASDSNEDFA